MKQITIDYRENEGPCDCCGFPLYDGDRAVWTESRIYCGKACAIRGEEYIRRRELPLENASYARGES